MLHGLDYALIGAVALAAGLVNAVAGGGTLLTFPTLTALGVPPIAANVTSTVALCPGFFGATIAQRRDLIGQERRLWMAVPSTALGGVVGGALLVYTSDALFRELVPYLLLVASSLLALQERLRAWLVRRSWHRAGAAASDVRIAAIFGVASIYGGYFGAGLGVIMLAVGGLLLDDSLTRLNALKSALSLALNVAAAVFFAFSGQVLWSAAAVMASGALIGGALGGTLASRVSPTVLRATVVTIGVAVAIAFFVK